MTQTRLKGPERRERFLDAAAQIVLEQGVWAVTMDGVAAKTGVNKSLGYRYFTDKDALLEALFDRESRVYAGRYAADLPPNPSFEDYVRSALRLWFRRIDERGELFLRLTSESGPLAERAKAMRQADVDGWTQGLQLAYKLPPTQARQLAWYMVAGVSGVLASRTGQGDDELIETITLAVTASAKALRARYVPKPHAV
ncbi:MAG: TetR/AcrR family transcriptional regulator [Caulobacter sp.]